MKPARMLEAIYNAGLVTDKDLKDIISLALFHISSTKYLDAVEKEVKEICEYERAKP